MTATVIVTRHWVAKGQVSGMSSSQTSSKTIIDIPSLSTLCMFVLVLSTETIMIYNTMSPVIGIIVSPFVRNSKVSLNTEANMNLALETNVSCSSVV